MKLSLFGLLFFSLFSLAEDWDAKYAEVCSYDTMCTRLKTSDGAWLRLKPEVVALLKDPQIQKKVKETAAKVGVDPVALAGAIAAENSLNVGVKDGIETFLAQKLGITKVAGKSFSFGLGQITMPAAREAEDYIAKIQNRKPMSDSELTQKISDPNGSIEIAGEIIRKVQDDYKAQGFDVSNNPGVLASLYNLGRSEELAKKSRAQNRLPRVNYFGLFVDKYANEIRSDTGIVVAKNPIVKTALPTLAVMKTNDVKAAPILTPGVASVKMKKVVSVNVAVPLVSMPLRCDNRGYGQDVSQVVRTSSFGAPMGSLSKDDSFVELDHSLDCRLESWTLVKGENGIEGWIKTSTLDEARSFKMVPDIKCVSDKNDVACTKSVKEKLGSKYSEVAGDKTGLTYAKPVTAKGGAATFNQEDYDCGASKKDQLNNSQKLSDTPYFNTSKEDQNEFHSDVQRSIIWIDSELSKMSQQRKVPIDQLTQPENPYNQLVFNLQADKINLQKCLNSFAGSSVGCYGVNLIDVLPTKYNFHEIDYAGEVDLVSATNFNVNVVYKKNYAQLVRASAFSPTGEELQQLSAGDIRAAIQICADRRKKYFTSVEQEQLKKIASQNGAGAPSGIYGGYGGYYSQSSYGGYGGYGMGMGGGAYGYGYGDGSSQIDRVLKMVTNATDDQIKAHGFEFVGFAKHCNSYLNLVQPVNSNNPLVCAFAPKMYTTVFGNALSEAAQKLYKDRPNELSSSLESAARSYISEKTFEDLDPTPPQAKISGAPDTAPEAERYCPNRTAEYINQLLDENPCIKHIYVPTEYLAKQLMKPEGKVVYRKFDTDGVFAIETGGAQCKK